MKELKLKLSNYHIEGVATILSWFGKKGTIKMDNFNVDKIKNIVENVNDGQFGCQEILSAEIDIYRNYEGHHIFARTIYIDSENYNLGNCQRGIKKAV